MAITVQPVDGLINRLLQQNGRAASDQYGSDRAVQAHAGQDSGSHSASKSEVNSPRERALESHLLDLYRSHDGYGG